MAAVILATNFWYLSCLAKAAKTGSLVTAARQLSTIVLSERWAPLPRSSFAYRPSMQSNMSEVLKVTG